LAWVIFAATAEMYSSLLWGAKPCCRELPPRPAPWVTWMIGHARRVEGGGDLDHLIDADLFALGMHAVAQAHVVQDDLAAFEAAKCFD
jgi:hypothetical protein